MIDDKFRKINELARLEKNLLRTGTLLISLEDSANHIKENILDLRRKINDAANKISGIYMALKGEK